MSEEKILVVDDEENIRSLISTFLMGEGGFDVKTAVNAEDALVMFRESPFSVVITDLKMPGMGGEEFLSEIKEMDPTVITIVLTGWGTLESASKVMSMGCDDYLIKPLEDLDQVSFSIRKGLWRRKVMESHFLMARMSKAKSKLFKDFGNDIQSVFDEIDKKLSAKDLNAEKEELMDLMKQLRSLLNNANSDIGEIHKNELSENET